MCRDQYTTTLLLLLELLKDSSIYNSVVELKISTDIMDEFFHIINEYNNNVYSFVNAIEYYKNVHNNNMHGAFSIFINKK